MLSRSLSYRFLFAFAILLFAACEKDEQDDPPPPGEEKGRKVGDMAEFYLQGDPYTQLRFTIVHMTGYSPKERAIDSLRDFLESYLVKPQGIVINTKEIDAEGRDSYSVEDLDAILDDHATYQPYQGAINAYLLIVDGSYSGNEGNTSTLGIAYEADRMALFGESINTYSNEVTEPERWKLQGTVMEHEFGHLLGLVDNGTPMVNDHRDGGNGPHCVDEDCLMYYATETSDVVGNLLGSPMPRLDEDCRNDLEANGGE